MSILRKNDAAWFSFKGITNTSKHVEMLTMPVTSIPAMNGKKQTAAGRSGFLWADEGSYAATTVYINCITTGNADLDDINKWLSGSGDLILSSEPGRLRKAFAVRDTAKTFRFDRLNGQEFQLAFDCQPFRYLTPAATEITVVASGNTVTNTGTVFSQPKIKIIGSGDIAVVIGNHHVDIDALDGTIIIDCELEECFDGTMTALLNDKCTINEFPRLEPGANIITWTGNVTSFVIMEPRWRYL